MCVPAWFSRTGVGQPEGPSYAGRPPEWDQAGVAVNWTPVKNYEVSATTSSSFAWHLAVAHMPTVAVPKKAFGRGRS